MRQAEITRKTAETDISLRLALDGSGTGEIRSGIGFLDHMLTLFARHGGFDLALTCKGDTQVDDHHSTEDIGICLGTAFARALGDRRGVERFGSAILPMDEALILSAVDLSGRGKLVCDLAIPTEKVGSFDTQLVEEFWEAFARCGGLTLHLRQLAGSNSHHIIEGVFKSAARSMKQACAVDPAGGDRVPSTKGMLV